MFVGSYLHLSEQKVRNTLVLSENRSERTHLLPEQKQSAPYLGYILGRRFYLLSEGVWAIVDGNRSLD